MGKNEVAKSGAHAPAKRGQGSAKTFQQTRTHIERGGEEWVHDWDKNIDTHRTVTETIDSETKTVHKEN